jgi:hypothetical protein
VETLVAEELLLLDKERLLEFDTDSEELVLVEEVLEVKDLSSTTPAAPRTTMTITRTAITIL